MSTLARPNITLSDNPTLEDLHMTGSVVVFEGNDLNGEQRVLEPGITVGIILLKKLYFLFFFLPQLTFTYDIVTVTGLFCYRSTKTSFRTWQVRQPSNDWVKKEYPVLSSESSDRNNRHSPVSWDEPIGFCPLSLYVPEGVVDFLGASGIQSAKATCQVPMRKHASVYKTKRVIVRNNRKSNARFISENVRNTACHLIVIRRLNVIATFFEFKHHKGRQFSIDFKNNKQFPLVLWTGMHCTSSSMPTNLYVNNLLPFTNSWNQVRSKSITLHPYHFYHVV